MNATSTILAVLSLSGAAFSQTVLHVDDDASPGGNGLSWVTAYSDLQVALAVARQPGSVVTQIWVAEGTYVPSQIGDRSVSFELHNGLALYGGFAGGETALAMRDPDAHVSLLSGDLLGDDVQPFMNNTDNSAHVVRGRIGVNSSALLDGFSIEGGAALNDDGGGIHLSDAGPTIRNCRIRWNLATDNGAGIYNEWNSPVVEDCLFESNRSFNSGGAWANFGLPGFLGGDPRCVRNRFVRNTAGSLGGAVRCHMGDMSFEACSFEENGSTNGADIVFNTSTSSVVDCTFERSDGVAILTQFTDLILESCVVREANESGVKFGVGSVVLRDCVFEDNFNQLRGGAAVVEATDVEFLRCTFRDNRSPVNGGALYLGVPSAPRIRDCTFIGNTSTASDAGAIDSESVGDPRIHNCVFIGNSASQDGGAVKMGTGEIVNSLFVGNTGGLGGALHVGGTTRVVNCTVVRNNGLSVSGTGGIYLTGSSTAVLNTILWDNRIGTNTAEIAQIRVSSGGAPAVFSDCSVMGYVGTIPGTNVGEFSPMFVDPLGPDGTPGTADDDLRLSAGSSLIDRGDTAHLVADSLDLDGDSDTLELVPFDLLGEPRAVDVPSVADSGPPPVPNVDLGAFEYSDCTWSCQATDVCNGDGGDQLGCTDCPCANNAPPGTVGGCLNSAATSARLVGTGSLSVSAPEPYDASLSLLGATPSSFSVLLSGGAVAPGNMANPCFGLQSGIQSVLLDGLRCAISGTQRHGGRPVDANGTVGVTTNGWGGNFNPSPNIAVQGGFVPGQTRHFQVIYRELPGQVCGTGLNTSQAISVLFGS